MSLENNNEQKEMIEQAADQWLKLVLTHISVKKNPELYPALAVVNKNKNKDYELTTKH